MARHVFSGVTVPLLERIAARNSNNSYDFQLNDDGRTGVAKGKTAIGAVELHFEFAPEREELTLTIVKKPLLVPAALFWAEFSQALREARADMASAAEPTTPEAAGG